MVNKRLLELLDKVIEINHRNNIKYGNIYSPDFDKKFIRFDTYKYFISLDKDLLTINTSNPRRETLLMCLIKDLSRQADYKDGSSWEICDLIWYIIHHHDFEANIRDEDGNRALDYALHYKKQDVAECILDRCLYTGFSMYDKLTNYARGKL